LENDEAFYEDLEFILIDHLLEADYKSAVEFISNDIDGEDVDLQDEISDREDMIDQLRKDGDLDLFLDKIKHLSMSLAEDEEIEERCKTEEAKNLFIEDRNVNAK
jgi:hypothetical protein